ncbi:MAG: adenylyltransferase/cytidyltransferase family protein [Opitutaceae bacterium]|nr:adenylyltransferase/cytidyltransferase family protein [Opitutaceae bacterium]
MVRLQSFRTRNRHRKPCPRLRMKIGYTTGVFDLFHIGHLNLLRNARSLCDKLVVGVTTDALVAYKHKRAVMPYEERLEIVRSCRYVDAVVPQETMDKLAAWEKLRFDVMFVGDDWFKNARWQKIEQQLADVGVKIVYFPYTKGTSSTLINEVLGRLRTGEIEEFAPGALMPQHLELQRRVA